MNKSALYNLSYGVYVVTTWNDGKPTGCTANSAMQITSSPATVAVSINHDNFTNECIRNSGVFAINILGEHCDPMVIGNFGFKSGRYSNKFADYAPAIKNFTRSSRSMSPSATSPSPLKRPNGYSSKRPV